MIMKNVPYLPSLKSPIDGEKTPSALGALSIPDTDP